MTTYVALLRGIMPMNPNMRNEKLKGVFESLGFKNVSTVIASGNVVFDAASADTAALEAEIEKALPEQLGFKSTTVIRSHEEIGRMIESEPFDGIRDEKPNYLIVTFLKNPKRELYAVLDTESKNGPDFMRRLEKEHGKEITTRTWKTVNRILARMNGTK